MLRGGTISLVLFTLNHHRALRVYVDIHRYGDKANREYRQLSRNNGCRGADSICQNYRTFWAPLGIGQGLYHQQWAVVFSSAGYILGTFVIPNVQNYVFVRSVYAGG